jgi:hypothetical protein
VEHLSPDPTMGTAGKAKQIERLTSRLNGAAVAGIGTGGQVVKPARRTRRPGGVTVIEM